MDKDIIYDHRDDEEEGKLTWNLWDADPDCDHEVVDAPGGGVVCLKCGGWFCW